MLLNNIDKIRNWMSTHTDLLQNEYEIFWEEDRKIYIVNTFCNTSINMSDFEIPVQFGNIDGSFFLNNSKTNNINDHKDIYWPYRIERSIHSPNIAFIQDDFKFWKTSSVGTTINFCGLETSIENLDFLENTSFEKILIKLQNTPFKDDIIPNYFEKDLDKKGFLTNKELLNSIIKKEIILDYFDFNIENTKEIK